MPDRELLPFKEAKAMGRIGLWREVMRPNRWNGYLAAALLIVNVMACASYPPGDPQLIAFLRDGSTTREDVYLRLAEPSGIYEGGRIMTYQLDWNEKGYVLMRRREAAWTAKYSLVLSFDDRGVLRRHSLLNVRDDPVSK